MGPEISFVTKCPRCSRLLYIVVSESPSKDPILTTRFVLREECLGFPIEVLILPERIQELLHEADMATIGDLIAHSRSQLADTLGIETADVDIIVERVEEIKLYLGWMLS